MPRVSTKQLTDTRCQRAKVKKHPKTGEPVMTYEWDSAIRGFGLRITALGTKTFCLKFVDTHGKQAWMPLGPYIPDVVDAEGENLSLVSARKLAGEYRTQIANGKDPRIEKKKALDIPTFRDFVKTHLEAQKKKLRPSSYKGTKFYLEEIAVPELGDFRINEVERFQVSALVDKVATGWRPGMKKGEKPPKPTPAAANRFQAAMSKLFTEAERKGLRAQHTNPCQLIEKQVEAKGKERFLTPKELEALGKVMRRFLTANAAQMHPAKTVPYEVAAIKLLMLTGARLNEILGLEWAQVDKSRGVIRIEKHKTSGKKGAKELPLNAAVLSILQDLEALPTRELKGRYVIQGHKHGGHLVNLQKAWDRIRTAAKCPDVRIHDLRHTFASVGVTEGMSLPMVGSLLGHSQPSVTNRYAHLDTDPRLQASEQISAKIASSLG
ncbi:site-specific integrase [Geothrix terrae]|uniref:site-specific integrase n=1 Tax=Geothrix terrae TaxID=2922720 RepID=UPI001FADA8C9|nr:site-specific integrase [Geothrix terrae]